VKFDVMNSQTYAGYVVHVGSLPSGSIKVCTALLCGYECFCCFLKIVVEQQYTEAASLVLSPFECCIIRLFLLTRVLLLFLGRAGGRHGERAR
jgi:hypothetical protein